LVLLAVALPMFVTAAIVPVTPLRVIMLMSGVVMLLLAASFRRLTVSDEGDHLLIQFGPLPLFRRYVAY
jgi:hypothetical protein